MVHPLSLSRPIQLLEIILSKENRQGLLRAEL
jgi:hypothetical protein